jgi:hypothetical protein
MSDNAIRVEGSVEGSSLIIGDHNVVTLSFASSVAPNLPRSESPFQGLDSFDETSSRYFFGREALVLRLVQDVEGFYSPRNRGSLRFKAILGPSGAGKSSIVRAGLVVATARSASQVTRDLHVMIMRPGADPISNLIDALSRLSQNNDGGRDHSYALLTKARNEGDARLSRAVLSLIANRKAMLIIDQFEELYSLADTRRVATAPDHDARLFVDLLLAAASGVDHDFSMIVTLRSDFFGAVSTHHPELSRAISKHHELVPALSQEELRRAIVKPLEVKLDELDLPTKPSDLIDEPTVIRIISETERDATTLPLLQYALSEIWDGLQHGEASAVTLARIGGVAGALARRADDLFDRLDPASAEIVQTVLVGAVQVGSIVANDARKRLELSDVATASFAVDHIRLVIEPFVRARLLTVGAGEDGTVWVELTHEALIRSWSRLREWVSVSRENLRFAQGLQETVRSWAAKGRPQGSLWREPDLSNLRNYAKLVGTRLPTLQTDFFDRSERQARSELRLRRGVILLLVCLTLLASVGLLLSLQQTRSAQEQRRAATIALAESLTADSRPLGALATLAADMPSGSFGPLDPQLGKAISAALFKNHLLKAKAVDGVTALKWGAAGIEVWTNSGHFRFTDDLIAAGRLAYVEADPTYWNNEGYPKLESPNHTRRIRFSNGIALVDGQDRVVLPIEDGDPSATAIIGYDQYRFSPDSKMILLGHETKQRTAMRPEVVSAVDGHNFFTLDADRVVASAFSPDSSKLVTYDGKRLAIWSTASNIYSSYSSGDASLMPMNMPIPVWIGSNGAQSYLYDERDGATIMLSEPIKLVNIQGPAILSPSKRFAGFSASNIDYIIDLKTGKVSLQAMPNSWNAEEDEQRSTNYWSITSNGMLVRVNGGKKAVVSKLTQAQLTAVPPGDYTTNNDEAKAVNGSEGTAVICGEGPCLFIDSPKRLITLKADARCIQPRAIPETRSFLCGSSTDDGSGTYIFPWAGRGWGKANIVPTAVTDLHGGGYRAWFVGPNSCQQVLIEVATNHVSGGYFGIELWDLMGNLTVRHFDDDQYLVRGAGGRYFVGDKPTSKVTTPRGAVALTSNLLPILCTMGDARNLVSDALVRDEAKPRKSRTGDDASWLHWLSMLLPR